MLALRKATKVFATQSLLSSEEANEEIDVGLPNLEATSLVRIIVVIVSATNSGSDQLVQVQ